MIQSTFVFSIVFTTIEKRIKTTDVVTRLLQYMRIVVNRHIDIVQNTNTKKISIIGAKITIMIHMDTNIITVMNLEDITIQRNPGSGILNNKKKKNAVKRPQSWKRKEEKNIWKTYVAYFHAAVVAIADAKNFLKKKKWVIPVIQIFPNCTSFTSFIQNVKLWQL